MAGRTLRMGTPGARVSVRRRRRFAPAGLARDTGAHGDVSKQANSAANVNRGEQNVTEESSLRIADADPADEAMLERMATLLVEEFREHSPAWPDLETALADVRESVQPEWIARVAFDGAGELVGWIGARPGYGGNVWELHPLVVASARQGRGIGRALVADLEERARERGGWTMYLGTDDEDGRTSLGGVDLYPDVLDRAKALRNLGGHPFEFYRKVGYAVVGLLPDANGFGKPDIFMAKRLRRADGGA